MVPAVEFFGQPFEDDATAASRLKAVLYDETVSEVTIAVAWARWSGVRRVDDALRAFRTRGGTARLIVGIDEGGATRPGLAAALDLFDEVFVFHDPGGLTFHPKVYLAEGVEHATLIVGSSNLTAGGLFGNYEASVGVTFDLPAEEDHAALTKAQTYLERLLGDENACRRLTLDLLDTLVSDGRYSVQGRERRSRRSPSELPEGVEEEDVDETGSTAQSDDGAGGPVFLPSTAHKVRVPSLPPEARDELAELEEAASEEPPAPEPPPPVAAAPPATPGPTATPPGTPPAESWEKRLSRADAQQPTKGGTNPTGVLRLSKAGHSIDWRTWFRRSLFAAAQWQPDTDTRGNPIETAMIPMDVSVGGSSLGTIDIRVDHAPHREAGQNNVPTVLHWGPTLGPYLRGTDYSDATVRVARLTDGSFQLSIAP